MPKYTAICNDIKNSEIIVNVDAENMDKVIEELENNPDVQDIVYIEIDRYEPTHLDWFLKKE
jgi:transcriptional/translational regulatory protein YebC/TACO1